MRGRGLERGSSPLPSKKIFLKTIILIDSVPAAGSRTGIIYCRDRAPVYINRLAAPAASRTGGPADSRPRGLADRNPGYALVKQYNFQNNYGVIA